MAGTPGLQFGWVPEGQISYDAGLSQEYQYSKVPLRNLHKATDIHFTYGVPCPRGLARPQISLS